MNILLTGGNGFLGKSFIEYFANSNYNIYTPSHKTLDLTILKDIQKYVFTHKITHIIHTAAINERRYAKATLEHFHKNLLMFENIIYVAQHCKKFIMFGSGAEFDDSNHIKQCKEEDISKTVPKNIGGLVKYIIAKRLHHINKPQCFYLRFFGGFGYHELANRFIKNSLINILNHNPIIIHQNKKFDFIYANDLAIIVNAILQDKNIPKDLNCVYKEKFSLLDIAKAIKNITKCNVPIIHLKNGIGLEYTGDGMKLHNLSLPLYGLKNGIQEMYNRMKKDQ